MDEQREHLDENVALDVLAGRDLGPVAAGVDAHLERCAACRRFLLALARAGHGVGPSSPAEKVDRYVLGEVLGSGAMGIVYAARDPELDRDVAIKLLRPGGVARSARERMAREARTLARLRHPNVVTVHDVGTHDDGVFIVMELVDGTTLRRWLAEAPRTWRAIVDVMVRAGHGLAAAHRAGLVHRDFKPDNVMIASDGRVLVTDFGLARAAGTTDSDPAAEAATGSPASTQLTAEGTTVGTPAYMAPEQHAGDAGPAADQFALCVALYEALHGVRPFSGTTAPELREAALAGSLAPPPAGSKVPARITRIVARGLRPQPGERYPAMEPLLAALERDPRRPVRIAVAAAAAVIVLVGATWLVTRAGDARGASTCGGPEARLAPVWNTTARTRLRDTFVRDGRALGGAAAERATAGLDRYAASWRAGFVDACEATHRRGTQSDETLEKRMACLDVRLAELDAMARLLATADAAVIQDSATAIASLSPVADCADPDALDDTPPPADPEVRGRIAAARIDLAQARVLYVAGSYKLAEPIGRDLVARATALGYPPLTAASGYLLGQLEHALGKTAASLVTLRAARLAAEVAGNDKLKALITLSLASVASGIVRPEEAAAMEREAEATVARLGNPPPLEWELVEGKAQRLLDAGDFRGALASFERSRMLASQLYGEESLEVADVLNNLGVTHQTLGALDDAIADHERALAIRRSLLGPDHPKLAQSLRNLAAVRIVLAQPREALPRLEEAIALVERALGPDSIQLAGLFHDVGLVYYQTGELEKSVTAHRRAVELQLANAGPDDAEVGRMRSRLAIPLALLGRFDEAKLEVTRSLDVLIATAGPDHVETGSAHLVLADVLYEAHEWTEAKTHYRRALAIFAGRADEMFPLQGLGRCELALGHTAPAIEWFVQALAAAEALHGADGLLIFNFLVDLAEGRLEAGTAELAIEPLERAMRLEVANPDVLEPDTRGALRFALARALWSRKTERARAATLATEARALMESIDPAPEELPALRRWLRSHAAP